MRIALIVIAYEAEESIEELLDRLPATVAGEAPMVLVSDDASTDGTSDRARAWAAAHPDIDLVVIRRPRNLGYGANQRATYRCAHERGATIAVLLHGDGQYPPELCDQLVRPVVDGTAAASYGSRMMVPGGARDGRMPLPRLIGNKALSRAFNWMTGAKMSEWFSGYRAYDLDIVTRLALDELPADFDFDIAITLRLLERDARITEMPIPTRYGDETSRVPLVRTGWAAFGHVAAYWWRRQRKQELGG